MNIELLYFDGCPSWQGGLENLKTALHMEGLDLPIELIRVVDDDDAARKKFLGSPSFRVNGVDLWDEERDTYSLSCRVYATPEGMKGSPTASMLQIPFIVPWSELLIRSRKESSIFVESH